MLGNKAQFQYFSGSLFSDGLEEFQNFVQNDNKSQLSTTKLELGLRLAIKNCFNTFSVKWGREDVKNLGGDILILNRVQLFWSCA